ncbi:MAG: manganese efflux pump [Lachnospiraceae bacterium]|nr:manganese efflux pump [Lachnospiraceae bacterium]
MKDMIIEILFLSAAISVDAFTASFAYGCRRIKIPVLSVIILNTISVLFLSASLLAGTFLSSLIPTGLTTQISFLILFVLGLVKLFEPPSNEQTENGDKNHDNLLSASEAFYLGLALSLDSLAAGIGAGMTPVRRPSYILITVGIALFTGILAIFSGCFLGKTLSARLNGNFCRLSGLILIALAFMKFF